MTVYELIRRLSEFPADWTVEYESDERIPKEDGEVLSNDVHGVTRPEAPKNKMVVIW